MSFSFRNLFSQGDEENPTEGGGQTPENAVPRGPDGQPAQPFFNSQGKTGEGNFQAMFDQQSQQMPMVGGSGSDPRGISPARTHGREVPKNVCNYLASELLAFIPPALAAQGGIPMEQTIPLEMPADGSNEVKLSAICRACPALFATEITPLNDSVITLPPKLSQPAPSAASPFGQPQVQKPAAGGIDIASMRQQTGESPFGKNPFADAAQSSIHPPAPPEQTSQPPAQSNPFADAAAQSPARPAAAPQQQAQPSRANPFADSAPDAAQQAQPSPANPFADSAPGHSQSAGAQPQPPAQANPFAEVDRGESQPAAASQPAQANPFADARASEMQPAAAASQPSPANPFATGGESPQQTPSQFGFPAPPAEGSKEDAQSVFSPFGASSQAAASAPATEPAGATPSVGFSAIGKFGEGQSQPARPAVEESIFPAGNPFEADDEPVSDHSAGGAGGSFFMPPEKPEAPANPFGDETPGAKAAQPTTNPFESEASFSTIFSEKAHKDEEMPAPGQHEKEPVEDLPTLDEALPPMSGSNPFGFSAPEPSAGRPANDPFAPLKRPEETPEPAPTPPPAPPEQAQSEPAPPQPPAAYGHPETREPEAEAPSQRQPSAGFDVPAVQAAQSYQRSPFGEPSGSAPAPAQPGPAEKAPPKQEVRSEDDSSDSFDDLSPFTAAISSKHSFFDELERDAAARKREEESYREPAERESEPEAPEPANQSQPEFESRRERERERHPMAPAPADSVVKNIELRAVFGTAEDFDVEGIARKTVAISGIASCAIRTSLSTTQASRSGESIMSESQIEGLAENARQIARLTGVGDAGAFTMHTDKGLISIFNHDDVVLAVRHSSGEFDPGVREKLMLITRGIAAL